ncbi:Uncharacterised protein [Canicola haemoglobinophilus]|uniref:Uncharacterized protein n=1 Tax=Canicola haemoglobinophilus TaxID=733 RepID=A0AB38HEF5_9PAST|nr:hypothetical protein [Canicola haemoglobinophilus]STO54757.1 Uncharacterised protein [Canicola haemoglobinophilus]STO69671.1 Uncharacterised protein [Canicola haemoglobinophilus]
MSIENKKYLGWGIVGTPAGRQQVGYGVDKQLNLAKTFDLAQEFGGCLIDPRQNDEPLYRLSYLAQNDISVIGVAEYRSIFEQGQTRAGTYFGAFIETVNFQVDDKTIPTLLSALAHLSFFQFENFIDPDKRAYTQSINGVEIQAPHEKLDEIAQGLTTLTPNYLTQTSQNGDVYIHCQKGEAEETLKLLLKTGVFYRYKQIFFSESQYISSQIQRKRVEQISFQQLQAITNGNQPWLKEISYLRSAIGKLQADKKQIETDKLNLQKNQAQMVAQELQEKEAQLQKVVSQYEQRAIHAEQQLQAMNTFTVLGQQIYGLYDEQKAKLEGIVLPQKKEQDQILEAISSIKNAVASLKMDVNRLNQPQTTENEEKHEDNTVLTWIFGIFSLILLLIFLGNLVWGMFISTDKTISEQDYKKTYQV